MRLRHVAALALVVLLCAAVPASAGLPPIQDFYQVQKAIKAGMIPADSTECATLDVLTYDADTNLWTCSSVAAATATAGAGLLNTSGTWSTASTEANFLTSGALTCGAATQGKMKVHTTALQYCDNAATPTLQYAAYGSSTGDALVAQTLVATTATITGTTVPITGKVANVVQTVTVADSGDGSAALSTVTPTSSYIEVACNDTDGCTMTLSETGAATGQMVTIINVSANTATFADTSGVTEIAGSFAAGANDAITLRYLSTSTWAEVSRSNN